MQKLSNAHLALIGRVVTECAALEAEMYDAITHILGLDPEDGLMLTRRLEPDGRIDVLRKLGVRHLEWPEAKVFIDRLGIIEAQLRERDFIIHADWSNGPRGLFVVSARTPTGYRSESFSPSWLDHVADAVAESRMEFAAYPGKIERRRHAISI